ncbi:MAG: phosphotransferase [Ruminococcus sp.]|nr:phosphotransferase [Ruminococcus sp.]
MLSRSEFEMMVCLKNSGSELSQRSLADRLGFSLGKVNSLTKELMQKKLIDSTRKVTDKGTEALRPYKVANAVIMAAGMSSRFAPLSYETPKGLLVVRGEVLIERQIRQLIEKGITDITIVVGYMSERFFYLEDKFGVKLVVNSDYYRYNNPSTLMKVLDRLGNTYICSSDNYFVENVFEEYVYRAYYSAVYASGKTFEYCLVTDRDDRIKKVTIGGENSWYMLGHVYFDAEFSARFKEILSREYGSPEVRQQLWENVFMRHTDELEMYIRRYDSDKVLEFDSIDELRMFDPEYINNIDSKIMKNICRVLDCEIRDITDIQAISAGLTNTSFSFSAKGNKYVYRHPGKGTEKYINRTSEAFSMKVASDNGLDDTFIYMDENEGWKISRFVEDAREMDYHNLSEVGTALKMMRKLHDLRIVSEFDFGLWNKTQGFIDNLKALGKTENEDFRELLARIEQVRDIVTADKYSTKCLCHNDCYSPNFIIGSDGKMYLIDWEYSGNDDVASDLGTFICCSDYSYDEALEIYRMYNGGEFESDAQLAHFTGYTALASFYWYVWALYLDTKGNSVGDWLYIWYKNSKVYSEKTLELLNK